MNQIEILKNIYCKLPNVVVLSGRSVSGTGLVPTDSYGAEAFPAYVESFTIVNTGSGDVIITLPSGDLRTLTAGSSVSYGNGTDSIIELQGLSVVGTGVDSGWSIDIDTIIS